MARAGINVADEADTSGGGSRHQPSLQDRLHEQQEEEDEGRGMRGGMSEEERVAAQQREKLRMERRKEMERDMRKDNMKGAFRKNKLDRDSERDVSEKIALGMHVGSQKLTGEEIYDARLFNQSGGGVAGDFGAEDDYNVYSKALFDKGPGSNIYRPRGEAFADSEADGDEMYRRLANTEKFRPDKGFAGADYGGGGGGGGRDRPVQFEKEGERRRDDGGSSKRGRHDDDDDFFGVGQLIDEAKGKGGRKDPLGHIGSGGRGMMAGSTAGSKEDYEGGSKRQKIGFSEAGSRRRDRSP